MLQSAVWPASLKAMRKRSFKWMPVSRMRACWYAVPFYQSFDCQILCHLCDLHEVDHKHNAWLSRQSITCVAQCCCTAQSSGQASTKKYNRPSTAAGLRSSGFYVGFLGPKTSVISSKAGDAVLAKDLPHIESPAAMISMSSAAEQLWAVRCHNQGTGEEEHQGTISHPEACL